MSNKKLAAAANAKGNDAFKAQDFEEAVNQFTQAISHDPTHHVCYSNRSACYACSAVEDGKKCVELKPEWPKGYVRKGLGELLLERYGDAAETYKAGLQYAHNDASMKEGLQKAMGSKDQTFGCVVGGKGGTERGGKGMTSEQTALQVTHVGDTVKPAQDDLRFPQQKKRSKDRAAIELNVQWVCAEPFKSKWLRSGFPESDGNLVGLTATEVDRRRGLGTVGSSNGDAADFGQRIMKSLDKNVWLIVPAQNVHALGAHKPLVEYIDITHRVQT